MTLGNINTLIALVNKLWGKKRIWITEYAWQTPPDRIFGVSFARQARVRAASPSRSPARTRGST